GQEHRAAGLGVASHRLHGLAADQADADARADGAEADCESCREWGEVHGDTYLLNVPGCFPAGCAAPSAPGRREDQCAECSASAWPSECPCEVASDRKASVRMAKIAAWMSPTP